MTDSGRDRFLSHAQKLTEIGIAISAERDARKILDMIVAEAMDFTNADAATLYLVSPNRESLHFQIVRNRTLGINLHDRETHLGVPLVTNADRTLHQGLEFVGSWGPAHWFTLSGNSRAVYSSSPKTKMYASCCRSHLSSSSVRCGTTSENWV